MFTMFSLGIMLVESERMCVYLYIEICISKLANAVNQASPHALLKHLLLSGKFINKIIYYHVVLVLGVIKICLI